MRFEPPRPRNDEERILPLINIVFLLLIFFMLAGRISATDPFEVTPPQSSSGSNPDRQDLLVLVDAEGRLALDGQVMHESDLKSAITERLGEDGRVRLKADDAAEATKVVGVMELLREAGVERLELLTVTTVDAGR